MVNPTNSSIHPYEPISSSKGKEKESPNTARRVVVHEDPIVEGSEEAPLIDQLPNEIFRHVFLYLTEIPGNFYAIRGVCKRWKKMADLAPEYHWNNGILGNGSIPSRFPFLRPFGQSIEETMEESSPYFLRFHKLTKRFQHVGFIPTGSPMLGIQPSHYAEMYHAELYQKTFDNSLEAVWPAIQSQIDFAQDLEPVGAAAIRAWLNNPANAEKIARINVLNLSGLQLRVLPPEIGNFTHLTQLNLFNNQLSFLPSEIGQLTLLTELNLSSNKLTSLPPEIGKLTLLTKFNLSNNQLPFLPSKIGRLTLLTELNLSINQLTSVPSEIGELAKLTTLDLSSNQLTSLPPETGELAKLAELNLSNNQLTSLPPEMDKLTQLIGLGLNNNRFTAFPAEISEFDQLMALGLGKNLLTSLPSKIGGFAQMAMLDLSDNQLTFLPPEIGELNQLVMLALGNNQIKSFPPEFSKLNQLIKHEKDDLLFTIPGLEFGA